MDVRFPLLESVVSQPNTLLMWPGPNAEDLKSFIAKQHRHGATDVKYTLLILDGTWHQARSLFNQNSFLHSLKQVTLLLLYINCFVNCPNNLQRLSFVFASLSIHSIDFQSCDVLGWLIA